MAEQTITIRLDFDERSFLAMVASRGGEIPFNWDAVGYDGRGNPLPDREQVCARVRARVDALIGKGTIVEHPVIGAPGRTVTIRLTDIGRNLVDRIRAGTPNDPNAAR